MNANEALKIFREGKNQGKKEEQLQIATLLPGEKGTTGGLGTMNREALDRYIKENGISGPAAGKLIKKWQGLHGGVNLPLANNAPVWPMHKWPHPTPGQGPLPNPNIPDKAGLQISNLPPGALEALKAGTQKGLSSRQIRDLLKPYTQQDQFGHPSGRMKV